MVSSMQAGKVEIITTPIKRNSPVSCSRRWEMVSRGSPSKVWSTMTENAATVKKTAKCRQIRLRIAPWTRASIYFVFFELERGLTCLGCFGVWSLIAWNKWCDQKTYFITCLGEGEFFWIILHRLGGKEIESGGSAAFVFWGMLLPLSASIEELMRSLKLFPKQKCFINR